MVLLQTGRKRAAPAVPRAPAAVRVCGFEASTTDGRLFGVSVHRDPPRRLSGHDATELTQEVGATCVGPCSQ